MGAKKKNKKLLGLLLVGGLLLSFFFIKTPFVAAFSSGGVCDSTDSGKFPYGFLCGSDNNDRDGIIQIATASTPLVTDIRDGETDQGPSGHGSLSDPLLITPRSSITFELGFRRASAPNPPGIPRTSPGGGQAKVLEWAWANGSAIANNTSSISGLSPGGNATFCPGQGGAGRGILYGANAKDKAPYTPLAPRDVSPAGWDGSTGYQEANARANGLPQPSDGGSSGTNCGPTGLVAYWPDYDVPATPASPGLRAFRFTLALDSTNRAPFCVRNELSVNYNDAGPDFNGSDPNAAHIAKQSDIQCYQMKSSGAAAVTLNATCTNVSGSITGAPSGGKYKIFVNGNTSVTNQKAIPSSGNYNDPLDGIGVFGGGSTHTFTVRIYNSGGTQVGSDQNFSITKSCGEVNASDCTGYTKDLGAHSWYRFTVFPRNVSFYSAAPAHSFNGNASDGGNWETFTEAPAQQVLAQSSPGPVANYHFDFPAPSGPDWLIYIERQAHVDTNGNGTLDSWVYTGGTGNVSAQANCYNASCTISVGGGSIPPGGGAGDHEAATAYDATATITDIGRQPLQRLDWSGNANANGNPSQGLSIGSGDTQDIDMVPSPVAPATQGAYTLGGAVYYGLYKVADCGAATVNVYQHFTLSPSASQPGANTENPTVIRYVTGAAHGTDPYAPNEYTGAISSDVHSELYKNAFAGGSLRVDQVNRPNQSFGSQSYTDTWNNTYPIVVGDKYCSKMVVDIATGWFGPGGILDPAGAASDGNSCITVNNEPYVHTLGADVSSGGGFDGGACNTQGGIKTLTQTTGPTPVGSGSMIAALARGQIEGFNSANLRSVAGAPFASTGLTFSNTNGVDPSPSGNSPNLGGNLGGDSCITNFFNQMPEDVAASSPNPASTAPVSGPGGAEYYKPFGDTLRIIGGSINTRKAIYVKGNVHITKNGPEDGIIYAGNVMCATPSDKPPCWAKPDDIPSFIIVALGGNIYIDNDVTQLDGTYVSQPEAGPGGTIVGGTIYSCSNGTTPYPYDATLNNCNKQLVVNGSFIANKILLTRSFGSLRNSNPGERLNPSTPKDCVGIGTSPYGDCAAEIFNFSPETYLNKQATKSKAGPNKGIYDSITSLSPVL